MKRFLALALGLGLVFTVAGTASAVSPSAFGDGALAGGIINSRHNLGAYGVHFQADNSDSNGGTTEVCLFCHTPHHGGTYAPLWNKTNQGTGNYTAYGSTLGTSVNSRVDGSDIGGATLACLSCHDGVNTFDTILNRAGKDTKSGDSIWTFTEDGNTVADAMWSGRLNVGTDLTNDHPVSISYTENVASLRAISTVISTITLTNEKISTNDETNSSAMTANRWVVSGYVNGTASIGNLLRNGRVECSSCHDPHFKNQTWDEVETTWYATGGTSNEPDVDGLFLRRIGGNSLSGVCRTCHAK